MVGPMGVKLADGSEAPCKTYVGEKGCPMAEVLERPNQDNIDLAPLSWLVERWCKHSWDGEVRLETPQGRELTLACWHRMPYLTSEQMAIVLEDLPPRHVKGRSGKAAGQRVAAAGVVLGPRAAAAHLPGVDPPSGGPIPGGVVTTSSPQAPPPPQPTTCTVLDRSLQRERIKKGLEHMRDGLAKRDWQHTLKRYEGLPDSYYLMTEANGPDGVRGHPIVSAAGRWHWQARRFLVTAGGLWGPIGRSPVDGGSHTCLRLTAGGAGTWTVSRINSASSSSRWPSAARPCLQDLRATPWGHNSRSTPEARRNEVRSAGRLSLQFLARMLVIHVLLGRAWLLEQPIGSGLLTARPLHAVGLHTKVHKTKLHQCMYGASLDGAPARKRH